MKVATVIGANGTMGKNVSAILASFGNMKVYMVARSLEKAAQAVESAGECVRAASIKKNCIPADYDDLERCIKESDFVFESVKEDMLVKQEINQRVGRHLTGGIIFATGTSGLSIQELAEALPESVRGNYLGVHFFNPPYRMTLCELVPTSYTDNKVLQYIKQFTRDTLYRTPVEVKDTPAFLGNRIGFQFINHALQYAVKYKDNGGIDYIDAILGKYTGRSMPPLATADFVGLDIHKAIVDNLFCNTDDYARQSFQLPDFCREMVENDSLGKKTGCGLYRMDGYLNGKKAKKVFDIESSEYREIMPYQFAFKEQMIKRIHEGEYKKAAEVLIRNQSTEAAICLNFLLGYILYSLVISMEVGEDIHSADDVMATGFGWCPPLAMIEFLGGLEEIRKLMDERLGKEIAGKVDLEMVYSQIGQSSYDFRKYIMAKR